ncbi:MAG: NUDIX hydrolase [Spirochaetales bacterium]|uniref:NUDIX hydrolase n=1 Tax=Candidatus Thalassospirochaeta sargassi TaxID=3119039 RepID=A0AAJ1IHW9_9SPIO|nr:NUDIX hydrolase [Spirochaetales bacterium]
MNKTQLIYLLERYTEKHDEKETVSLILSFLTRTESMPVQHSHGHLTGSAWLVNPRRDKAFLVHHAKLDLWVQPGGHLEEGEEVVDASRRECMEETGINEIRLLDEDIFDIDIHLFPERMGNEAHTHFDIRFLFEAESENGFEISDESHDGGWFALGDIDRLNDSESISRMVRKTRLPGPGS